jgi:hypothetical protein
MMTPLYDSTDYLLFYVNVIIYYKKTDSGTKNGNKTSETDKQAKETTKETQKWQMKSRRALVTATPPSFRAAAGMCMTATVRSRVS